MIPNNWKQVMFKYQRNNKGADIESAPFFVAINDTQTAENQWEAWYTNDIRATLFCVLGIADASIQERKFVPYLYRTLNDDKVNANYDNELNINIWVRASYRY